MQAYEGYFENGDFYSQNQAIHIPERMRTILTILDEPVITEKKPVRPPFKFGCAGDVWMAEDFDAPLEEMKEYME